MNFLALCQAVAREAGVSGTQTLPATVTAQTGELGRVVEWTRQAWLEVLQEHLWGFLWEEASLTLPAGSTGLAAGGLPVRRYVIEQGLYVPTAGSTGYWPDYLPWHAFRTSWPFVQPGDRIGAWSITPNGSLRFNVQASADIPFVVERYALPITPLLDADTPPFDEDLHMVIAWRAVVKYAGFDEAGVQRATAADEHSILMTTMRERHLPHWQVGAPLGEREGL